MHGLFAGLAAGLLATLGVEIAHQTSPDAGDHSVAECLRGCDAAESETDRATCRITCEERQNANEQPDVVKWTREELKGGSPDPNVERGSTTTITEISPSGTKTRVVKDNKGKPGTRVATPMRTPRGLAHAMCQSRCERRSGFGDRAMCRLGCAEREYRRRGAPTRSRSATPKAAPAAPSKPSRACTSKCLQAAATCQEGCRGEDRATCVLHCDQTLATCERRC